jgi:hypothetical protein
MTFENPYKTSSFLPIHEEPTEIVHSEKKEEVPEIVDETEKIDVQEIVESPELASNPDPEFINFSSIYTNNKLLSEVLENFDNAVDELIVSIKDFIHINNVKLDAFKAQIHYETYSFKDKIDKFLS